MTRISAILCVLLFASNASAALLFELRDVTGHCRDCSSNEVQFAVGRWTLPVTASDVGKTFDMPADALQEFSARATSPMGYLPAFSVRGGNGTIEVVLQSLTNDGYASGLKAIRHVPIIGPNLVGYTISNVTQTVNSLLVETIASDRYHIAGNTTIRIYGEAVPEPTTWVQVSVALVAAVSIARKRWPSEYCEFNRRWCRHLDGAEVRDLT